MADYTKYTKQEMQAYAIAKNIKENQIVIENLTNMKLLKLLSIVKITIFMQTERQLLILVSKLLKST